MKLLHLNTPYVDLKEASSVVWTKDQTKILYKANGTPLVNLPEQSWRICGTSGAQAWCRHMTVKQTYCRCLGQQHTGSAAECV